MSIAEGSAILLTPSMSRDHMNVSGDARALTWERKEPGTTFITRSNDGSMAAMASRNRLVDD